MDNKQNSKEVLITVGDQHPGATKFNIVVQEPLALTKKYQNVRKQGFIQRYAVSDHLKTKGNILFKENQIEAAIAEYSHVSTPPFKLFKANP